MLYDPGKPRWIRFMLLEAGVACQEFFVEDEAEAPHACLSAARLFCTIFRNDFVSVRLGF